MAKRLYTDEERLLRKKAANLKYYYKHRGARLAYGKRSDVKEKAAALSRAYRKRKPHIINALSAKRKASKLQRTPPWLTKLHYEHIRLFYKAAKVLTTEIGVRFVVDHIVPLQGKNVSGLHVPWNLQVITHEDNAKKSNNFG